MVAFYVNILRLIYILSIVGRKDIVWKRAISYCSKLLLNIFLVPGLPKVHTKIKIAAVSGEFLLFEQIFLRFPAFLKDAWRKLLVALLQVRVKDAAFLNFPHQTTILIRNGGVTC